MNDELARRLCKAVENLNQKCDESDVFPNCNKEELSLVVAKVKEMVSPGEYWVVQGTISQNNYQPCGAYMAQHEPYWAYGNTWEECFEQFRKDNDDETTSEKLDPPIPGNESAVS